MGNAASGAAVDGFDDAQGTTGSARRLEKRDSYEACVRALRAELAASSRPAPLPSRSGGPAARPRVVMRKRPLFEAERERELDVLSADGPSDDVWGESVASALWVTRPMLAIDHDLTLTLRPQVYAENHAFYADAVFDETRSTAELYAAAVRPLITEVIEGALATVMCFGQTGSGKTHTTAGILAELAADLPDSYKWRVCALEVTGVGVTDLMHGGAPCVLRDARGATHVMPDRGHPAHPSSAGSEPAPTPPSVLGVCPSALTSGAGVLVSSATEAVRAIVEASRCRATSATTVHAASSRSHAIYTLEPLPAAAEAYPNANALSGVQEPAAAAEPDTESGGRSTASGCLTLVDLAGSEWARDQSAHATDRIKETQEVNRSLMTLKACLAIRGSAATGAARMPSRDTALTRVLRAALEGVGKLLVIATASPCSADAVHAMSTLHHVGLRVRGGRGDANGGGDGTARVVGSAGGGAATERSGPAAAPCGARVLTRRAPSVGANDGEDAETLPPDPCSWSTTSVVSWWLHATAAAAESLNARPIASGQSGEPQVVVLRSTDWPAAGKLGISFEPPRGEGDEASPVVSRISDDSPLAKMPAVARGAQLVACELRRGDGPTEKASDKRSDVLALLKTGAAALSSANAEPPSSAELILHFSAGVRPRAAPPRVPRAFTGNSRLGLGKGSDLLSAFADASKGLRNWTEVCDGHAEMASAMYSQLRAMAEPFGGTPEERLEKDRLRRAEAAGGQ